MVKGLLRRAVLVGTAALGLCSSACVKEDNKTQLTVGLTTETMIPKELDELRVTVIDAHGSTAYDLTQPVNAQSFFPTTIALIPHDPSSLEGPVKIEVQALLKGDASNVVLRRAVVPYVEGRTLLVPMALRMACFHIDDCKANETCKGGECKAATLDAAQLADYDDKLVFGSAEGATCFDEDACLGGATPLDVSPTDCSFPLAPGQKPNIAVEWKAAPGRVIVLDVDDGVEGFTVDAQSGKGKLSPGVCQALIGQSPRDQLNRALRVYASSTCPAKRRDQPPCKAGIGHELMPMTP